MTMSANLWARRTAVVFGLCMLWCGRSAASPESVILRSQGLTKFYAREYAEALSLFDDAFQTDPTDIEARYYRGVTLGRLGEAERAVEDLRAVATAEPDLHQAQLELGIALFNAERYEEAIPWLERAQASADMSAPASLFLGLTQYRLAQDDAALQNLQRVAQVEELRLPARYYQGLIFYRRGDALRAEEAFSDVIAMSPATDMGREASHFLDVLDAGRPYDLHAGAGIEYDSNIVLAPSDSQDAVEQAFGITNVSDGRVFVTAGGRYVPWRTHLVRLSVGYDFYQSVYFQNTDFSLQDHRPSADITVRTSRAQFGLVGQYSFDLLGTDAFLHQFIAMPWIAVPEGEFGETELLYRLRSQDFLDRRFEPLDAYNHAVGLRQLIFLNGIERYVWLGYRFDLNDTAGAGLEIFGYTGHRPEIGVAWALPKYAVGTELSYAWHHRDYDRLSRRDNEHDVRAVILKRLSDRFAVRAAYLGTFSDSTIDTFSYDRHVVSLGLEVHL